MLKPADETIIDTVLRFGKGIDQVSAETAIPEGFARRIVNLDVTNTGTLFRRSGITQVLAETEPHSLWSEPDVGGAYYVAGSTLYGFDGTTKTSLVTGLTPGFPCSYAQVSDDVYWSNGVQSGILVDGVTNQAWAPSSTTGPLGQTYMSQVKGSIVRYFKGRLYVVDGRTIWATEPMDYTRVDLMRGFILLDSEVTLFEPVSSGIYVGTEKDGVRFLAGSDFKQFPLVNADSLTPVRGSGVSVDGAVFDSQGQGAAWLTTRGWVFGTGDGSTRRLTDAAMALPQYTTATSIIREANGVRQLMSFAKGGSGSAGASDSVTSEVIRNGVLLV
jgi:hypothetical protein